MDLTKARQQAEALLKALTREAYLCGAGLKPESERAAIYDRFAELTSLTVFRDLQARAAMASPPEQRLLAALLEWLGAVLVEQAAASLLDRVETQEAQARVRVDGEEMTFRQAEIRLEQSPEPQTRRALQAARLEVIAACNPLRRDAVERMHETAWRLGFPHYRALAERLSGLDLTRLEAEGRRFLRETEDMYLDLLRWYLRRALRVHPKEAASHDLAHLFRAPDEDAHFPPGDLVLSAHRCLERMRLDPTGQGRITLDLEPRPTKSPRAFCAPLDVPREVVLVVAPRGGREDYTAFFHELGHALHFAHTDPELPFELRYLGDQGVTETHAFLLGSLIGNSQWLKYFLKVDQPESSARLAAFHRLYLARRQAAKLGYELVLHGAESLQGLEEVYAGALAGAVRVEWPATLYLADVDPWFYTARYLRAWWFEAQLEQYLVERYDEEWYRNDRTGGFLKELWHRGQSRSLEELGSELGLGALTPDQLIRDLTARLS